MISWPSPRSLFATLLVLMTFALGRELLGATAAWWSAVLLATSTGRAAIAHVAIVDRANTAAYWVAVLALLQIWRSGHPPYVGAGLAVGIAVRLKARPARRARPLAVVSRLSRRRETRFRPPTRHARPLPRASSARIPCY